MIKKGTVPHHLRLFASSGTEQRDSPVGPLPAAPVAATRHVSKAPIVWRADSNSAAMTGNVSGGRIDSHVTSGTECSVGHVEWCGSD